MSSTAHVSSLAIEHALLGFLCQHPMHGYEIYQRLRASTGLGLVWHIKRSQLYALLTDIERQGYVAAATELQDGRPPRRVFHLTEAGRAAFLAWLNTPVSRPREMRLDFLAKLFFARRNHPDLMGPLLEAQRAKCLGWLADLSARAEACDREHAYERLVWQFRARQVEAMLSWLTTCSC
jgi:PadR family transcriptional regulator AphA